MFPVFLGAAAAGLVGPLGKLYLKESHNAGQCKRYTDKCLICKLSKACIICISCQISLSLFLSAPVHKLISFYLLISLQGKTAALPHMKSQLWVQITMIQAIQME